MHEIYGQDNSWITLHNPIDQHSAQQHSQAVSLFPKMHFHTLQTTPTSGLSSAALSEGAAKWMVPGITINS